MNYNFWSLVVDDPKVPADQSFAVQIGFPPDDFVYTPGKSQLASFEGHGTPYPVIQWIRGTSDEVTFKSIIWHHNELMGLPVEGEDSRNKTHDAMKKVLGKLLALKNPLDVVARPPICIFVWTAWNIRCLVENISGISPIIIDRDGIPLGYRFSITLKRYFAYSTEDSYGTATYSNGQNQSGLTRFVSVNDGDTYELIADREYGDPMVGVALRRLHYRDPFPTFGKTVKVPSVDWTRRVRTASRVPESPILRPGPDQADILSDRLNNRTRGGRVVLK